MLVGVKIRIYNIFTKYFSLVNFPHTLIRGRGGGSIREAGSVANSKAREVGCSLDFVREAGGSTIFVRTVGSNPIVHLAGENYQRYIGV